MKGDGRRVFNVLGRLQELHKIPPVSCVDKSQPLKEDKGGVTHNCKRKNAIIRIAGH